MARPFSAKVVTANALLEGDVIYLSADGGWVRNIGDAELFLEIDIAKKKLADAQAQSDQVVGAYLADAKAGPSGPEPVHFRETFRQNGPSNYRHGKQTETLNKEAN